MKSGITGKILPIHKFKLLVVILACLLAECTASKKPSKMETTRANMTKDVVIPIEAEEKKNPVHVNEDTLWQGKSIHLRSCAICHGDDGHTVLGLDMYPPVMDLTSPHVQHWNDAELFWIIHNLQETSVEVAALSETPAGAEAESSREQLIEYGRTLDRQEGCFICHRLNSERGKVEPDLTVEGTRGRTDAWLIGHFKDPPAYTHGSIMPAFKILTDEKLKALAAFLQSQKGNN